MDEKLTVRSRDNESRLDFWFDVSWDERSESWEHAFSDLVQKTSLSHGAVQRLECVPFTASRGWIVARGVEASSVTAQDVQASVSAVVADVNARIGALFATAAEPSVRARPEWTTRALASVASLFSMIGVSVLPQR